MIRLYVCRGNYAAGHRIHVMTYRDGRIASSDTGPDARTAIREARAHLSMRRRERYA